MGHDKGLRLFDAAQRQRHLGAEAAALAPGAAGVAGQAPVQIEQRHHLLVALDIGDARHGRGDRPARRDPILARKGRRAARQRIHQMQPEIFAELVDAAEVEGRHGAIVDALRAVGVRRRGRQHLVEGEHDGVARHPDGLHRRRAHGRGEGGGAHEPIGGDDLHGQQCALVPLHVVSQRWQHRAAHRAR